MLLSSCRKITQALIFTMLLYSTTNESLFFFLCYVALTSAVCPVVETVMCYYLTGYVLFPSMVCAIT